ncbi:MAG: NAD-glutamate dehydrogenase, partial [Alphaproteobacteria bacterium]
MGQAATGNRLQELIDRVGAEAARAANGLGQDAAEDAARFVRAFYAHVPPEDVLTAAPRELAAAALALWRLGDSRPPVTDMATGGTFTPRIRVYSPDPESDGWKSPHTVVDIIHDDMPFLVDSITRALAADGLALHLIIHPVVRVQRDGDGRRLALIDDEMEGADEAAVKDSDHRDDAGTGGSGDSGGPGDSGSARPAIANGGGDRADTFPRTIAESCMHLQIDEQTADARLRAIEQRITAVLGDVRSAVGDWQAMRQKAETVVASLASDPPPVSPDEIMESRAFVEWLRDGHFTFLGYREYDVRGNAHDTAFHVRAGSGLGILRDDQVVVFRGLRQAGAASAEMREFLLQPQVLLATKANLRGTVHRTAHLDCILVKDYADGVAVAERVFVGFYTSTAYSHPANSIPFLRRKVRQVISRAGFDPQSHNGKALENVLESFPRDELFQIDTETLYDTAIGILNLHERQRVRLFMRNDPFGRFVSALVFVPREAYDTRLRTDIGEILARRVNGQVSTFYPHLADGSVLARIHYIIRTRPGQIADYDTAEVEREVALAAQSWTDQHSQALVQELGEERGLALLRDYAVAFPLSYRDAVSPEVAVRDIAFLEEVRQTGDIATKLYRPANAPANRLCFKVFHRGGPIPLSDILPILENLGLRVISEIPHEIKPEGSEPIWIHDFHAQAEGADDLDLQAIGDLFRVAFSETWHDRAENDGFNRLVLAAGLNCRQISGVRALAKYRRQAGTTFSQASMEAALAAQPHLAGLIIRLFQCRFDPAQDDASRDEKAAALAAEVRTGLDAVEDPDQDRILAGFLNLVESCLRTNVYQTVTGSDGVARAKSYMSFKFDSQKVDDLPLPRPMVEIFVYSPRTEGVHLRGGKVARGGIRWSDRREDFRTEVLGLMKAQMVKNAVIVPVGSKGGFVVKRPPADRDGLREEVVACYQTLIRGLLDITDNRLGDSIQPPPQVVRHDDDDPYLVVAADKGTATFSDIANALALEYGFWLGDAFASGGANGYDHKKMGITARGAWESVKRHFREMGRDTQSEDFTVVGVGDMSGDVFGNGMLLSPHIRLLAAFNHMHIFVDPEADTARGFAERQRLFDLPRSAWSDYDPAALGAGGRIYERRAKSLKLTPEIRARFHLDQDEVTPNALMRAILTADADLLWFGGIGTYVKAAHESNSEVGDRANDAIRVNAGEVRARVVAEGANLGLTQFGRIAYAQNGGPAGKGGRINTDAIDNSAGVDASDHEVNIKILLDQVVRDGELTGKQRNDVLASMTDEVGLLVLRDNYLQAQAISIAEHRGFLMLGAQKRLMLRLERQGKLNRVVENLPDDEVLAERQAAHRGLTRPEFAVLLSYAKINLYEELIESTLPDDSLLIDDLVRYFPTRLRETYAEDIRHHRLRREIVATSVTNSLINRAGVAFANEMMERTSRPAADVARAYAIARDSFDLRSLWAAIEALDTSVPAAAQMDMQLDTIRLLERVTLWLLRTAESVEDVAHAVAAFAPGIARLAASLDSIMMDGEKAELAARAGRHTTRGVPEDLARRVASLETLAAGPDIVGIADAVRAEVEDVGRCYFAVGDRFGFEWLRDAAMSLTPDNDWQRQAQTALVDDAFARQSAVTAHILADAASRPASEPAVTPLDAWAGHHPVAVTRVQQVIGELR